MGVLARGADCTNVLLARLIAGVQKASLDVHDISPANGSADVFGYEVSPANSYCSGTGKRMARTRLVERMVSWRRRIIGRTMELVNVHNLFWRSAIVELSVSLSLSILDASFKFDRVSYLVSSVPRPAVLVESYVFSVVIGVFAGLTSALVRMHRERASHSRGVKRMPRAVVGGWSSFRADKVQVKLQVDQCQVACSSLHRARSLFGAFQSGRECDVVCAKRESRGLPGSVGAISGSLGVEIDCVRWFLSRGKRCCSRSTFHLVCCSIC